ncbi:BF3164 family lipoprotein [uncultured Bacteroides sp.]|uniref:BF3164 family lipoprotein n=1 Tax=uncultured Bacteroides sp. TaxID=162156 RepID=UPI002AABF4F6|nr:BF3164 family lipoprotein [uncultured Bacteroides sp.]
MKQIILFFILLFCISCSLKKGNSASDKIQNEKIDRDIAPIYLKGEPLSCDSTLWGTSFTEMIGSYFIMQSNYNNPIFFVYELVDNKLIEKGRFLNRGDGPFEMLQPYSFYDLQSNQFYLYDFVGILKSMYRIDLRKMANLFDPTAWNKIPVPETSAFYMGCSMIKMNDSTLLTLGSRFNSSNLFSTLNLNAVTFHELNFPYPLKDGTFNMESVVKQSVYMDATIVKHPTLNKFVYACGSGKYANIIAIEGETLKEEKTFLNVYPKYRTKDGANRSYENNCLRGMQVRVTSRYIYIQLTPLTKGDVRKRVLYKEYPNYCNDELLVFNWDGVLIKKYTLDVPIYSYVVDSKDQYLYGISVDLKSDNPILKCYQLR